MRSRLAISTPTWSRRSRRKCSARSSREYRSAASARPMRSPAESHSCATRMPASSPVRRCRSTAGSTCIDGARLRSAEEALGDYRRAPDLDQSRADVLGSARSRGARTWLSGECARGRDRRRSARCRSTAQPHVGDPAVAVRAEGLAPYEDPRLSCDLGEHRCADMALAACAGDELPELVDTGAMLLDIAVDAIVEVASAAARQEVDSQLLEVTRQPGGKQPFPLVRGHEAGDLLLGPVEAERLAEPRVSAGDRKLVELVPRRQRRNAKHAVELVKPDESANDFLAGAEREQ